MRLPPETCSTIPKAFGLEAATQHPAQVETVTPRGRVGIHTSLELEAFLHVAGANELRAGALSFIIIGLDES
jgi:hypothetical protein